MPDDQDEQPAQDWIERAVRFGRAFGLNETKLRWKLLRWRDKRVEAAARLKANVQQAQYEHAVCPECGRIQARGAKNCIGCEAPMAPHAAQVLRRVAGASGIDISAGMILGVLIALCYVRQIAFTGSAWNFDGLSLLRLGAHYPALEWQGQWWRLGTAMFLHGNIIHVAFNMMALIRICPPIEDIFGRGRTLFLYVATGLVAFLPSTLLHWQGLSIGASGAIMGLIGVAAGWGQRDGTTIGKSIRNQMLSWLVATTVMGFFVHADHSAHITGFLAGGLLGFFSKPVHLRSRSASVDFALGAVALIVAIACVALVILAPARNLT